jgi:hypothetical protein
MERKILEETRLQGLVALRGLVAIRGLVAALRGLVAALRGLAAATEQEPHLSFLEMLIQPSALDVSKSR